jgi:glycosyltransferase involved in cell wall biosynthesis
LAEQGHEPHIFTFAPAGDLRVTPEGLLDDSPHFLRVPRPHGAPELPGVQVHYAPALPLLETGYYFSVRYPLWMRNLLREMDVLHVHHPFISGRLAWRARREDQALIFSNHTRYDIYSRYLHDMVPRQVQPLITAEMLARRLTLRAARFANNCDYVVAPSASVKQVLENWGVRTPIEVVPNGVDLSRFDERRQQSSTHHCREKAGTFPSMRRLLFTSDVWLLKRTGCRCCKPFNWRIEKMQRFTCWLWEMAPRMRNGKSGRMNLGWMNACISPVLCRRRMYVPLCK